MLSEQKRAEVGMAVMAAMQSWKIADKQKLLLLSLDIKPRVLPQVAQGKLPLPADDEVLERAHIVLGISQALRDFFPLNAKGGAIWLKHTNKYFPEKPPLAHMLEDGLPSMHKVWRNLDCTQGWD